MAVMTMRTTILMKATKVTKQNNRLENHLTARVRIWRWMKKNPALPKTKEAHPLRREPVARIHQIQGRTAQPLTLQPAQ